jgi:hypothetical protein
VNPTATDAQPLRYFIHDDFDAFRMELAGGLVDAAARGAYETWRVARLLSHRARVVVDISYVTQADEEGKAVLQAWQEQEAHIVASSPASFAIANSITLASAHVPSARRPAARRLGSFFSRPTAENLANAEASAVSSAASEQKSLENSGFPFLSEMEQQVR